MKLNDIVHADNKKHDEELVSKSRFSTRSLGSSVELAAAIGEPVKLIKALWPAFGLFYSGN
jgi:hypothetical protein